MFGDLDIIVITLVAYIIAGFASWALLIKVEALTYRLQNRQPESADAYISFIWIVIILWPILLPLIIIFCISNLVTYLVRTCSRLPSLETIVKKLQS